MSDLKEHIYTSEQKRKSILAIVRASSGNLVEWFDFYIYAFTSIYFAHLFFPSGDTTSQLLKTAGVLAAGFLMRPVGGWVFGRIADRYGRKKSLVTSILLMCFSSLLIACLPTYDSIGVFAPIMLLVARLIQGLSVGGEYGSTAAYMSEVALPGKRGFFSSFQYVTLIGGQLLATLVILLLIMVFSVEEMRTWAWRIPFFLGAAAALYSLSLRKHLKETAPTEAQQHKGAGSLKELFGKNGRACAAVIGITAGGSLVFYTFTTYMQKYLINSMGFKDTTATEVMTLALFIFMLAQPVFGMISDRIGRRACMLLFSGLGAICTYPALYMLQQVSSIYAVFAIIICMMMIISFYTSISGIVKSELFPAQVRALGVGFPYAIANALFGGSAEYVALSFKNEGIESGFFVYVTIILVITFIVCWFLLPKEVKFLNKEDYTHL